MKPTNDVESVASISGLVSFTMHRSVNSATKRLIDLIGGIVGVAVLAAIFIPIAIAIRLDSPGPILYRQVRCGLRGKPFTIYKFRSMVQNADAVKHLVKNESVGHVFKNASDPRVTRVGKFLRKTSLDEFPQFLNVVKGDMSLVGTRPPTLEEVQQYSAHHWRRLSVRPGITGEWQVRGRSNIKDFETIVSLDLVYQERWSPLYDLYIVFRTFLTLFRGRGSY